jgi:hypothetical protein
MKKKNKQGGMAGTEEEDEFSSQFERECSLIFFARQLSHHPAYGT